MDPGQSIRAGVKWLIVGNSGSQFLQFVFGVILARLLVPADFGMIVTVQVFTGFVGMLASGGMGQALIRAKTIAEIYKSRWQIELFFKCIKQNLKIKSFLGTSRNALLTQIWIAMCAYLLLAWIKFCSRIDRSLQQMVRLLQLNLFDRRDLLSLLKGSRPEPPDTSHQFKLRFS